MINCDTTSKAVMKLDGRVTFRNPYGQLDAEEFGYLPVCLYINPITQ
jgi:hypothetical protein